MKKSDLKTGMRVKTRDNEFFLIIKDIDTLNYGHQDIVFVNKGFINGTEYDDNLTNRGSNIYDIVEVFNSCKEGSYLIGDLLKLEERYSIWKRPEWIEEQKEIFKALKVLGFKYIARDSHYDIYAYESKPKKNKYSWCYDKDAYIKLITSKILNKPYLNFIDWEDEEPFEIPIIE